MKRKNALVEFKPIPFDSSQVGLMIRIAVLLRPSLCREIGAESPEEVEICADLIAEGCPASDAVLCLLNLRWLGKGQYEWIPQ